MDLTVQVPILGIDEFLIASIQIPLDDLAIIRFQEDLLKEVAAKEAAGVILDITALDVVDSFMARMLDDIAVSVRFMGAETAIVGIQPTVAIPLVRMGLKIPNAVTALSLQKAITALRKRMEHEGDKPNRVREADDDE
jgi:rsbT antagonist protein RsbS